LAKILYLTTIFILSCCLHALAGDETVLAEIGSKKITLSDFEKILQYYPEDRQKLLQQNPRYKPVLLKRIVEAMVLSDAAKKEGFDKTPEIKAQIELQSDDLLAVEYLKHKAGRDISVTEEGISQYYRINKDEFKLPERVRARHILVKVEKDAGETDKAVALNKAKDILKKIKAGKDFAELANEFSEDPGTKGKGGDLGYFSRGKMVKPFEDAAFSLEPGSVSEIVETKYGHHIIKLEDRKPEEVQSLEEVKDRIKKKLFEDLKQAKIKEIMDNAMKDAGAKIYTEKLLPAEESK